MDVYRILPTDQAEDMNRKYGVITMGGIYLLMDSAGDPLYVGCTNHWISRRYMHMRREYWPLVAEVVILSWHKPEQTRRESWDEYGNAEAHLIRTLCPPYNIKDNPQRERSAEERTQSTLKGWETRRRNGTVDHRVRSRVSQP